MCAEPIIIIIIIIMIIIIIIIIIIEVLLLTIRRNYRRSFLTGTTHHSTLGMFRVAADGAAITAIPLCRGSGSMSFNIKYCSHSRYFLTIARNVLAVVCSVKCCNALVKNGVCSLVVE
jgi:hypothetical protein